jgi:hypothetical protein
MLVGIALVLTHVMAVAEPADAASRLSAHVEGGFGSDVVRPMARQSTPAAMASAGASVGVVRLLRIGLEVTSTGGSEFGTAYIPEAPRPGTRTLRTLLAGLELGGERGLGAPYAFAGMGVGRRTLKDAFVGMPPRHPGEPLPRDLTTLATGAALGYRFRGGPSAMGWQLGLRVHGLVDAGAFAAWAGCATVGLAY